MALPFCREIGLEKVLIACIDGNIGSEKTILANGGVYESTVFEPNSNRDLKRFWISLFERVYLNAMIKAKVDKYIQKQIDL